MRWLMVVGTIAAGVACATTASAFGDSTGKPLYEFGIFGGTLYAPDYPASNQSHIHFLPLPYIIYRGRHFQVDEKSVRGILLDNPRFSLDLSASASFETGTNDRARQGMPSLDYLGEAGPRLRILLAHDAQHALVDFELPLRVVLSTNLRSRLDYRGLITAPELAYTNGDFLNTDGTLKLGLSSTFATRELMGYFYDVAPPYVVPGRPQYKAEAGYLGSGLDISYRIPVTQRLTLFSLADASYYGGATNASSPLFKSDFGLSLGFGATFSFYASDERAAPLPEVPVTQVPPTAYGSPSTPDLRLGSLAGESAEAGPHVARPAPRQIAVAEPPPARSMPHPRIAPASVLWPTMTPPPSAVASGPVAVMPATHVGKPRALVEPVSNPIVSPEPRVRPAVRSAPPPAATVRRIPLLVPGDATNTASSDGAGIE
ncbi:MAG: MipA/OmpV family protein [Stellaceae bacterium]